MTPAITVREFIEWAQSLPPQFLDGALEGFVGRMPHGLKRVIAYRWKGDGPCAVAANPLGTHYGDEWMQDVEFVSILNSYPESRVPKIDWVVTSACPVCGMIPCACPEPAAERKDATL